MRKAVFLFIILLSLITACTGNNTALPKNQSGVNDADGNNSGLAAGSDDNGFYDDSDTPSVGTLQVLETALDFGTVYIWETPRLYSTRYIHVNNTGLSALTYTTSTLMNDFYYDTDKTTCGTNGGTLEALGSCIYVINFKPVSVYEPSGTFRISSGNDGKLVKITGKGISLIRGIINADYRDVFFPTTTVGTTSEMTITAKNTGHVKVKFDLSRLTSEVFSYAGGTCTGQATLMPGATCTIVVRFAPHSFGAYHDLLIINSRDTAYGDQLFPINLNGSGILDGVVGYTEDNVSFGLVKVGEFKDKKIVVTNKGQLTLKFKTTFPEGFYNQGSTCNVSTYATLKQGKSCEINVRFRPDKAIVYTDYIRFSTNKSVKSKINMIAAGYVEEPLNITPIELTFPPTIVGATSETRKLLLTNTARLPIAFKASALERFTILPSSTCSANTTTLMPDKSCEFHLVFKPDSWKHYEELLTFTYTLNIDGQLSAKLIGDGISEGYIKPDPTSIAFGRIEQNTSSPVRQLTVKNDGGTELTFTTRISTPFTVQASSTCVVLSTKLLPGESCRYDIVFSPTALTTYESNLEMLYNGKTVSVSLSGTGSTPADIAVDPLALAFGDIAVGTESTSSIVNIRSTGGADAIISYTIPTGYIERGGTCTLGMVLQSGTLCTLNIIFAPPRNIVYNSNLAVTGAKKVINVALTGTGYKLGELTSSNYDINFGNTPVGSISKLKENFTLTNTGDRNITFTSVIPADFIIDTAGTTCAVTGSHTLAPAASCKIALTFKPTRRADYDTELRFNYSTGGGISVRVRGKGINKGNLIVTPPALNFNNVVVGKISSLVVSYLNDGDESITVTSGLATAGVGFSYNAGASTCSPLMLLAAGQRCTVVIDFTPTAVVVYNNMLNVRYVDSATALVVARDAQLTGAGVPAGTITVDKSSITFPDTPVKGTSSATQLIVKNEGGSVVTVTLTTPPEFVFTSSGCTLPTFTLAPNTQCLFSVVFKPTLAGARNGNARFSYNSTSTDVSMSGVGLGAILVATPNPLDFGEVAVGRRSTSKTITITNPSDGDVFYTFVLPPVVQFIDTGSDTVCYEDDVLLPGASCTLTVALNLTEYRAYTLNIILRDLTHAVTVEPIVVTAKGINPMSLTLSPMRMVFNAIVVNTNSDQMLVITNSGGRRGKFTKGVAPGYTFINASSTCDDVNDTLAPGEWCSYLVRFSPLAANSYNNIINFFADGGTFTLTLEGRGIPPIKSLAVSSESINFLDTPIEYKKKREVTLSNITKEEMAYKIKMPFDFELDNSSTCGEDDKLKSFGECRIVVAFESEEIAQFRDDMRIEFDNDSINVDLQAATKKHGYVKYLEGNAFIKNEVSVAADNDTLFLYSANEGALYSYSIARNLFTTDASVKAFSAKSEAVIKDGKLYIFFDNSTEYYRYDIATTEMKERELLSSKSIMSFDNSTSLVYQDKAIYLIKNDNSSKVFRFDDASSIFVDTASEKRLRIKDDSKKLLDKKVEMKNSKDEIKIFTPQEKLFFIRKFSVEEREKKMRSVDFSDTLIREIVIDDTMNKLSTDDSRQLYYDGAIFMIDKSGRLSQIFQ